MSETLYGLMDEIKQERSRIDDLENRTKSLIESWPNKGDWVFFISSRLTVERVRFDASDWDLPDENMFQTQEDATAKLHFIESCYELFEMCQGDNAGAYYPILGGELVTRGNKASPFGFRDASLAIRAAKSKAFKTFATGGKE